MRMIAPPSLGPWVELVGNVVCGFISIPMGRRCSNMCTARPRKTPPVTPMNGRATTKSSVSTTLCVTARKNGRGMTMAMASARSIPTRAKGSGQRRAIFCVRFAGFTRSICTPIWPWVNIKSISNVSVPRLSLGSSLSTDQLHEPNSFIVESFLR